jgi:hypothetical protein
VAASARERSRSWSRTVAGGRSASGGMTRSFDRDTGAYSRQASQTGPNGRSRSATGAGTVQDGTYTGTRSVTAPNGTTRTMDIEASRN